MTGLVFTRCVLSTLPLVALTTVSFGQSTIYTLAGDGGVDAFGASVSDAGDVNGDGFGDLIVGAPGDDNNGLSSGTARVFSGLDGSVLFAFDGDGIAHGFGLSVSGAGDVNGDGFADVIVGTGNLASAPGYARVFSGQDGSTIHTFVGDSTGDFFGTSVSGAGDVDGDGFADLIVGARMDDNNGNHSGSARVFSGRDGSIMYTFNGAAAEDFFGASVDGAGDVDGDGLDDLIVGAHGNFTMPGRAVVLSGADGSVIHHLVGDSVYDGFGAAVGGAGDVDGDGVPDLIIGASGDDNNGSESGSARVFSGVDGSILYTFDGDSPGDRFGGSVSGVGDVNGDGFADLIVGASGDDNNGSYSGSARVFSGVDGSILYTLDGDAAGDGFGRSVSGGGEVDGDGFADPIVGAPQNHAPASNVGYGRVFSGLDDVGTNYCGPANLNSTSQPGVIGAKGSETVQNNVLVLMATQLPPQQFGFFITSQTQAFVPFAGGSEGNLCVGGTIGRFRKQIQDSGPSGSFSIPVDLTDIPVSPSHSVQPGETWNFQAWFRDKNPTHTSNFTDGVSVTFV